MAALFILSLPGGVEGVELEPATHTQASRVSQMPVGRHTWGGPAHDREICRYCICVESPRLIKREPEQARRIVGNGQLANKARR